MTFELNSRHLNHDALAGGFTPKLQKRNEEFPCELNKSRSSSVRLLNYWKVPKSIKKKIFETSVRDLHCWRVRIDFTIVMGLSSCCILYLC